MADRIDQLPPSTEKPSTIDMNAMRELFGNQASGSQSKVNFNKLIIPAAVFVILSLPMVDNLLKSTVSDSDMMILFAKTVAFLIVLLVLQLIA